MEEEQQDCYSAREAAKQVVRTYYKESERSGKARNLKPLSVSGASYDAQIIGVGGQVVIDHEGETHHIDQGHLVITRLGHLPCFAIFALAELLEEIADEERGFPQGSLAAIFAEMSQPSEIVRRRPVIYRAYNAGRCQNPACRKELGYIETDGGRTREYCSDACRVAAYRARKREAERQQVLQYNSELRQYWQENQVRGEILQRLQEILLQHGKQAAKAATDAVLSALQTEREAHSREHGTLVDAVMAGGEAIGFEELRLDEFRIAAGFEGWSQFVSYASHESLKEIRYYLQERRHEEERRAQRRKRLEEFGRDVEGVSHATS